MKKISKVFYDSPIDILKLIVPIGFDTQEVDTGYAHLIEHLVIRSNYDILGDIEVHGGWFNGTTREHEMEIVIYCDPDSGDYSVEELVDKLRLTFKNLTQKEFEEELDVIQKEYSALILRDAPESVGRRIGNLSQIGMFELDKAEDIISKYVEQVGFLLISGRYKSSEQEEKLLDVNIGIEAGDYTISGKDKDSFNLLKLLFCALTENGYSEGISNTEDTFCISKELFKEIDLRSRAIADRFKVLTSTSFSKYNHCLNLVDNNWQLFSGFDFGKIWRQINEKICGLC